MKLNLKRPAVVFDLETTGINIVNDRIIEISIIKIYPDGLEETKTRRINPGMPIPAESIAVHGITDEDVKDCPLFKQIAHSLYDWIKGCDIIGFNSNKFDVPFLVEELLRAGVDVDLSNVKFIDVQNIFHKMERRTLEAAYKFYCAKELKDAHSAEADTRATYEVLEAQLDKYSELINDVDFLSQFSTQKKTVDFAGTLIYDDKGEILVNIGKYKGQPLLRVFEDNPNYVDWIQKSQFAEDTKRTFYKLYLKYKQEQAKK